jgi:hypothetical protein
MTTGVRLALLFLLLVLLIGLGAWYYLFGPNKVDSAELVPSNTVAFATVPNAARIVVDYETSHLKTLADSPNAKPLLDAVTGMIGQKNFDLIQTLLPDLSGQSFIAVTRFDPSHPAHGEIIGLRPKAGTDHFDAFEAKLKTAYPGFASEGTAGAGQVEGLDYQWIQGAGVPDADRICTARYRGWVVMAGGEDTLRDWWERIGKKATSPSLAENHDYQESVARVGKDFEGLLYLNGGAVAGILQRAFSSDPTAPAVPSAVRAFAVGSHFAGGEIEDHFSLLMPRSAQSDLGLVAGPCAFETLKFTGPDTRFYWGASFNWPQVWKNLQAQSPAAHPVISELAGNLQNWAQAHGLDVEHNIVDTLAGEISVQAEWSDDSSYPDAGVFLKLNQPDALKPVIAALLDTVRQDYANRAVVNELNAGDRNFATLKFVEPLPISPTITEDGPYFGFFLTETHAVRSFQRDETMGLMKNSDFTGKLGDQRAGAAQLFYFDSPRLVDRAYQTVLPYLSLAAMLDRNIGALLQNRTLPPDLHWLAPMGAWSQAVSSDDEGLTGYSESGIGNQGLLLAAGTRAAFMVFPALGRTLRSFVLPAAPVTPAPAPPAIIAPASPPPPPAPDSTTNAPATPFPAPSSPANPTEPAAAPAAPSLSPPATNAAAPAPAQ